MIPGLEKAEFARLGGIHRNTYLNSPRLLDGRLRLKAQPRLRFAGQITGCEGYVESAAVGLIAGRFAAAERLGLRAGATAADHRDRRAPQPHHRRPHRKHRRRPALVPADERQFRPLSADRRAAVRRGGQASVWAGAGRRPQARAVGAGGAGLGAMGGGRARAGAVRRGLGCGFGAFSAADREMLVRSARFWFSWIVAFSRETPPILGGEKAWISLDSLVISYTYQWVNRIFPDSFFLPACVVAKEPSNQLVHHLACEGDGLLTAQA